MAYGAILGQSPNQALTQQLQQHIANLNNPHQVTTAQIGAATETALNQHVGNTNNPHQVTAGQIGAAPTAHTHDASAIVSGTLPVARGGTGITTNPSMLVNLGVGTTDSVFKNSPRPGVTGILSVANGGTGANNAAQARTNLGITASGLGAIPTSYLNADPFNISNPITTYCQYSNRIYKVNFGPFGGNNNGSILMNLDKTTISFLYFARQGSGQGPLVFYVENVETGLKYYATSIHSALTFTIAGEEPEVQFLSNNQIDVTNSTNTSSLVWYTLYIQELPFP